MSTPDANILVLGVGNILLADEGFGPAAIYYLQSHYVFPANARLVDGGTRGLMLMAELMECDAAVILDIMLGGEKPGSIYFLEDSMAVSGLAGRQSMHQTGVMDILASCELAGYRPPTAIFGLEPFDFGVLGPSITPQAQERLPKFCAEVVGYLRQQFNMPILPKPGQA